MKSETMARKAGLVAAAAITLVLAAPTAAAQPDAPYPGVQLIGNTGDCALRPDMLLCEVIGAGRDDSNHIAMLMPDGSFQWTGGTSLGDLPTTLTPGVPLHANGWTAVANGTAIRITNDATGHGMTVSGTDATPF